MPIDIPSADLYPDTLSDVPSSTVKDWMNGRNIQPNLVSLHNGEAIEMSHSIVSIKKRSNGNDNHKLLNNDQHYTSSTTKLNGNKLFCKRDAQIETTDENHKENDQQRYDNNSMKFAFLAQQTIPDYRPQAAVSRNEFNVMNLTLI